MFIIHSLRADAFLVEIIIPFGVNSIEKVLSTKEHRTKDLHGNSNTVQCAKAVLDNIK